MTKESITTAAKVVGVILIFCIFGVGILLLDRMLTPEKTPAETFEEARQKLMSAEFDGVKYMRNNVETYMIAGLDKYENDATEFNYGGHNNNQADFIVLLVVNKSTRRIDFINLNRDTYTTVDVPADKYGTPKQVEEQLCLAHTYGDGKKESGENLRNAVNHLLYDKVRIDHFLTMKMDAVKAITDFLGGVTVTLNEKEDLASIDPSWTAGATITLSGDNALKFIRYRDTLVDGSNADRIDRQSRFLKSLLKAVGDKKWSRKYLWDAYEAVGEYTATDYGNIDDLLADLETMFEAFGRYEYGDVVNIVPDKYGKYEKKETYGIVTDAFMIDDESFKELVVKTFFRPLEETNKEKE